MLTTVQYFKYVDRGTYLRYRNQLILPEAYIGLIGPEAYTVLGGIYRAGSIQCPVYRCFPYDLNHTLY